MNFRITLRDGLKGSGFENVAEIAKSSRGCPKMEVKAIAGNIHFSIELTKSFGIISMSDY